MTFLSLIFLAAVIALIVFARKKNKKAAIGCGAVALVFAIIIAAIYEPEPAKTTDADAVVPTESIVVTTTTAESETTAETTETTTAETTVDTTIEETETTTESTTTEATETETTTAEITTAETVETQSGNGDLTVYITDTGERYHDESCRHLDQSEYAVTLREAVALGLSPCRTCEPPKLVE
jgi:cytoskeletal protein RodZ